MPIRDPMFLACRLSNERDRLCEALKRAQRTGDGTTAALLRQEIAQIDHALKDL